MKQEKRTYEDFEEEFKGYYIEFLKANPDIEEILQKNQETLTQLQREIVIDSNSIAMLPAYFNFIECYLETNNKSEVKKYLTVALSNLSFSNKKKDEMKEGDNPDEIVEDEKTTKDRIAKTSRIDLLFGRYNLQINKLKDAMDKITNSILLYAEIYGPESVGLTPHYYYLATLFLEQGQKEQKNHKDSELIAKNIFLKIADIWKKYFLGEKHLLYEQDVDDNLNLAIGDYYILKITHKLIYYFKGQEKELELKYKYLKVIIAREREKDCDVDFKNAENLYKDLIKRETEEINKVQIKEMKEMDKYPKDKDLYPEIWNKIEDRYKIVDKEFFLNLEAKFQGTANSKD